MSQLLTPEEKLAHVEELFVGLGYEHAQLRREFPVLTTAGLVKAPLVAFASDHQHDMTTSALVGAPINGTGPTSYLELARALASPIAFLAADEHVEVWRVAAHTTADEPLHRVTYDQRRIEGRLRAVLDPERLAAQKNEAQQLSLFERRDDLLAYARAVTTEILSARVDTAMRFAVKSLNPSIHPTAPREAARMVVGAVSALMIGDKHFAAVEPGSELAIARKMYPDYFEWMTDLDPYQRDVLSEVSGLLRTDLSYEPLDASIVSGVYEQVMAEQPERKRLGIFYTPPWLASRIVSQIPIEHISPDERCVLDPACGSGTFLLASYDRLIGAMPRSWPHAERAAVARSKLAGADTDEFAVEISRLALLLNAQPDGNGFDVLVRDISEPTVEAVTASIVVTNPPWRHTRSFRGSRHEVSDDFVLRLLDLVSPEGFLSVVLPVGFCHRGRAGKQDKLSPRGHRCSNSGAYQRTPSGTLDSLRASYSCNLRPKPGPMYFGALWEGQAGTTGSGKARLEMKPT